MTVYVFSRLIVEDADKFGEYIGMALPTIAAHGGRLIAADNDVQILDGEWAGGRTVMVEFDSSEDAHAWFSSAEYQIAAEVRRSCSYGEMVLVAGAG